MKHARRKIVAREITVDIAGLAEALGVSKEQVSRDFFTQTSLLYAFGRSWVENAFAVATIQAPQRRGYMLARKHRELGGVFNIRGLMHGQFQPQNSIRKGAIREAHADRNNVIEDTAGFDSFVIVDGKEFPRVILYPIPTQVLLNFMDEDGIDKAGISRHRFAKFLRENFDIEYRRCTEHQQDEPELPIPAP